jgi:DNA ligase 4
MRMILRTHWKKVEKRTFIPSYLTSIWNPSSGDRPDAYVDSPEHSLVVEVKASELMNSTTFPAGYTLRFPRMLKIRED